MQERMLGEGGLAAVVGPLKDLMEKLGGREGGQWFFALKRFLRKENPWEAILGFLGTITAPATNGFVVRKDFGGVAWMSDNFKNWFVGKTEESQSETQLRYSQLLRRSVDGPIVKELGGEEKAATSLAHLDWLMRQQADGQEGSLLVNGYANIIYALDRDGKLRAVHVRRYADGWSVGASSVGLPVAWNDGSRILSRDSLPSET